MKVDIKYVWAIAFASTLLNVIESAWTHTPVHIESIGAVIGMSAGLTWIAWAGDK